MGNLVPGLTYAHSPIVWYNILKFCKVVPDNPYFGEMMSSTSYSIFGLKFWTFSFVAMPKIYIYDMFRIESNYDHVFLYRSITFNGGDHRWLPMMEPLYLICLLVQLCLVFEGGEDTAPYNVHLVNLLRSLKTLFCFHNCSEIIWYTK